MKPIVSGIIICFNGVRFLAEAIQSIVHQTFDEWELLLVEDGSTDGSAEVAQDYAQRMPRQIRYLEHDGHRRLGMAASRNLGIQAARGRYIAFLDSDDRWVPEKLAQQVTMLDAAPTAAMIYGRTLAWHSWGPEGERLGADHFRELGVRPNRVVPPPELLCLALQNGGPLPSNSNALWRRSIAHEIGGFEPSFRTVYSDVTFYVKVLRRYPVLVSSQCWDWYRQHAASAVHEALQSGEWHPVTPNRARARLLQWIEEYFSAVGETRAELLTCLRSSAPRVELLTRAAIAWKCRGVQAVEVRVNAPDGPLLSAGGPQGSTTTGQWVRDGTAFFLQDVTNGTALVAANTLAVATIWLSNGVATIETGSFLTRWHSDSADDEEFVSWAADNVDVVEIHRDRPDGDLVAAGITGGCALPQSHETATSALLMQNVTARLPLTWDNTLCRLDVLWRSNRSVVRCAALSVEVDPIRD